MILLDKQLERAAPQFGVVMVKKQNIHQCMEVIGWINMLKDCCHFWTAGMYSCMQTVSEQSVFVPMGLGDFSCFSPSVTR
jgi:hypothetical protein